MAERHWSVLVPYGVKLDVYREGETTGRTHELVTNHQWSVATNLMFRAVDRALEEKYGKKTTWELVNQHEGWRGFFTPRAEIVANTPEGKWAGFVKWFADGMILQDRVDKNGFYRRLACAPPHLTDVEVAKVLCGGDGYLSDLSNFVIAGHGISYTQASRDDPMMFRAEDLAAVAERFWCWLDRMYQPAE